MFCAMNFTVHIEILSDVCLVFLFVSSFNYSALERALSASENFVDELL